RRAWRADLRATDLQPPARDLWRHRRARGGGAAGGLLPPAALAGSVDGHGARGPIEETYMTTFTGKKILVVGGSLGIGGAIVRRFAADRGTVAFTFAGSERAAEALAA